MLCGYKGYGTKTKRPGAIRHAFTYHAYSFPYTALENNPLYLRRASGNLQNLFDSRIVRGRTWARQPVERRPNGKKGAEKVEIVGEVDAGPGSDDFADLKPGRAAFCSNKARRRRLDLPDNSVDFIVTDPPYFDSVQYSDLAAFFRVWLHQLLPEAANWELRISRSAVDRRQMAAEPIHGRSQRYFCRMQTGVEG